MKTKELAILAVLLAPAFTIHIGTAEAAVVMARPVVIARPVVAARPVVRAAPIPATKPSIATTPKVVVMPISQCSEKEHKERKC